jgi:hypothetical protein
METSYLQALPHAPSIPVAPPTLDALELSLALESSLKQGIQSLRSAHHASDEGSSVDNAMSSVPDAIEKARIDLNRLRALAESKGSNNVAASSAVAASSSKIAPIPSDICSHVLWDTWLESHLQSALASYETDRLLHVSVGGEDFASSIRRYVPPGFAFRGFPILFNHLSPGRMIQSLLDSQAAHDILSVSSFCHHSLSSNCPHLLKSSSFSVAFSFADTV